MGIFRSTRQQRRIAAEVAASTVTRQIASGDGTRWPIDHSERCTRCSYCK